MATGIAQPFPYHLPITFGSTVGRPPLERVLAVAPEIRVLIIAPAETRTFVVEFESRILSVEPESQTEGATVE